MFGIPSPPAHGGSWAVSKSTTVFFWYPFFQMKSFTAFCSVLILFSLNTLFSPIPGDTRLPNGEDRGD